MGNPASEYVHASSESSPVHAYIADHGEAVDSSAIRHDTIAGHSVAVSDTLTDAERELVAEAIRAIEPRARACFDNSLQMWKHNGRFKYAEGFAVPPDAGSGGLEHAWCMLDGEKLVDVTTPFVHYHGVMITDGETLRQHHESGPECGVIGNHTNRFEFLRERGYIEEHCSQGR